LRENEASESLETDIAVEISARKPDEKAKARKLLVRGGPSSKRTVITKQVLGKCERCGYLSSQAICQACVLLEGLNKNRPQIEL